MKSFTTLTTGRILSKECRKASGNFEKGANITPLQETKRQNVKERDREEEGRERKNGMTKKREREGEEK